jgi:hypothetical protein
VRLLPSALFCDLDDDGTAARVHVVLIALVMAGTSCAEDAGQFRFNGSISDWAQFTSGLGFGKGEFEVSFFTRLVPVVW